MNHQSNRKVYIIFAIVAASLVAAYGLWFVLVYSKDRSGEARVACEKLLADAKAGAATLPGYTVTDTRTICGPKQDELGSTDYSFNAYITLSKDNVAAEPISQTDVDHLAAKLPASDYHWLIRADPAKICLLVNRYLDHAGDYIDQPPTTNIGTFSLTAQPICGN